MTIEAAIRQLESLLTHCKAMQSPIGRVWADDCAALNIALSSLRAPTLEQVEKVWRGEWLHDPDTGFENCDICRHTISLDDYSNRKPPLFCEMCGRAMTDKAVDIIMERLEALNDGETCRRG